MAFSVQTVEKRRYIFFQERGRDWETKRFPTKIRSRNSLPTRKTARFKAFLCRWNVLFIHTVTSSKS